MRVLFVPLATPAHYYPMVPIAWAFRTAGHDVRVAGQPPITHSIINSGMPAVEVGGEYDLVSNLRKSEETFFADTGQRLGDFSDLSSVPGDALRRYAQMRREAHVKTAEAMASDLIPFVRAWQPDLVIGDLITMVAPLAAEVAHATFVLHSWGPQMPSKNVPKAGLAAANDDLLELYDRYGAKFRAFAKPHIVDPCPPTLQSWDEDLRIICRYVPYNGSGVEPSWLRESIGLPRVCVSWSLSQDGTFASQGDHLPKLIAALEELDVETVVTVRSVEDVDLKPATDRVRIAESIPLQMLLPTCSVAVHHGGAGTMLTAAAHGIPQVIVPPGAAQVINANRAQATGIGISIAANTFDPSDVSAAVSSMLPAESTWRKAAVSVQQENDAQDPPDVVVRRLEQLVAGYLN
jgi:UDP:flavonoid glycosyltransferase YjiC (YdhE family)